MNKRKTNARATSPSPPLSWGLFTFDPHGIDESHLRRFTGMLLEAAQRHGLPLGPPLVLKNIQLSSAREILNVFENTQKRTNIELLFMGIPARHEKMQSDTIYKKIKVYGQYYPRIKTQCFRTVNARQITPCFFDAFILKAKNNIGQELGSFLDADAMQSLFETDDESGWSKALPPPQPVYDRLGFNAKEVTF